MKGREKRDGKNREKEVRVQKNQGEENCRRKIIEGKKLRGEWSEAVFLACASQNDVPVAVPWGDVRSFDAVVGVPGNFKGVQIKCTVFVLPNGEGYKCCVCSHNKPYPPGSFDFLAAYVVPEDVWYIIPEKEVRGMKCISLCTQANYGKYEKYREAWHLLKGPKKRQGKMIDRMMGCAEELPDEGEIELVAEALREFRRAGRRG